MLSKPSLQASFLRAIVRVLSEWLFYLGFVWALSNQARQTWHDKLASVVKIDF
nr:RDD family protein [Campylobacter fetus]